MTLATNKDDLTVSATDHPEHHNALATAVNRLDGRVFDVTSSDYGADPTGVAGSSTAITAAIAAASVGDTIFFPDGIYLLNANIAINKAVNFIGSGMRSTRFRLGGNNIGLSFNDNQASAYQQIVIGGFLISSTSDRSAGSAMTLGNIGQCLVKEVMISNNHGGRPYRGITITSGCTQTRFQELMIFNCADYGIYIYQDGSQGSIIDLWFEDGSQVNDNENTALKLYNAAPSLVDTIEGIYVGQVSLAGSNNSGRGMDVDVASTAQIKNVFVHGTIMDGNEGAGFATSGAGIIQVVRMENIWVSHNHTHGIILGDQVQDFLIDGGHVNINYADGIQIYGAKNGRISNVSIASNAEVTGGSYGLAFQNNAARITCVGNRLYNNTTIYPTNAQNGVLIDSGCSDIDLFANFLATGGASTPLSDAGTRTRKSANITDATNSSIPFQSDIDAAGGYRQTIDGWYAENPTGTAGPTVLTRLATTTDNPNVWIAPRAGSITAVSVHSNAARATGTLTATVRKNATPVALTAVLDGTNTTFKTTTSAKDTLTFAAGDLLDVTWTTSSWTPTTADIRASIEVET